LDKPIDEISEEVKSFELLMERAEWAWLFSKVKDKRDFVHWDEADSFVLEKITFYFDPSTGQAGQR
jgi:hypothetical protein